MKRSKHHCKRLKTFSTTPIPFFGTIASRRPFSQYRTRALMPASIPVCSVLVRDPPVAFVGRDSKSQTAISSFVLSFNAFSTSSKNFRTRTRHHGLHPRLGGRDQAVYRSSS